MIQAVDKVLISVIEDLIARREQDTNEKSYACSQVAFNR